MRDLPAGTYRFDDIEVGDRFETGFQQVTAEMIKDFARLSGDRFEIHLSAEGAARHGFPNVVAHGLLILSLADGLKNSGDVWIEAQAALGWNQRFTAPVFAGDRIAVKLQIAGKRPLADGARGILALAVEVVNQDGVVVLAGEQTVMAYR